MGTRHVYQVDSVAIPVWTCKIEFALASPKQELVALHSKVCGTMPAAYRSQHLDEDHAGTG